MPEYSAFTVSLLHSLWRDALLMATVMGLLALLLRRGVVLARRLPAGGAEAGFAHAMQFLLLTPLLLMLLLIIFQVGLIMQARIVVNYAAFCAARSALVVVPAAVESAVTGRKEASQQFDSDDPQSPKLAIVRRAAALACVGISPPWSTRLLTSARISPIPPGLATLQAVAIAFPARISKGNVSQQLVLRAPYAFSSHVTQVALTVAESGAENIGTLTARVTYRYYLAVPFASRLFGTKFAEASWFGGNTAFYAPIAQEYTLPLPRDPFFPADQQDAGEEYQVERFE